MPLQIQQPMPKVQIRGLQKSFGDQSVLDGLDLDIQAGHHLVLLGVSGSGKTVLLKCILGLVEADSGIDHDRRRRHRRPTAGRQ